MPKLLETLTKLFAGEFLTKLTQALKDMFNEAVEDYRLKKQVEEKVKEIQSEKDAQVRAKRIRDLLNS
jgi:hypothetical protein